MLARSADGVQVIFDPSEAETGEVIAGTVGEALPLIYESWGVVKPADCRIYVMTSWWGFFVQSTPWVWRIYLTLAFPLWGYRARRMWPYSGAWTQYYGRRVAIGMKPPRLLTVSDKSIGKLLFVEEPDMIKKLQQFTCHELTHACAARLRLPAWLNEGLAMVTVDRLVGKRTVREDTLGLLKTIELTRRPPSYLKLSRMKPDEIAFNTALGYWLVCYLEEVQPGFLKSQLAASTRPSRWEENIIAGLGIEPDEFWSKIPAQLNAYFLNRD